VTSDPPLGSSTYHSGSVNFKQRARYGLTFNANYTYSHTLDNSTIEILHQPAKSTPVAGYHAHRQ